MRIGFGLGNMGAGMAATLVGAGHEVRAFDLSADALAARHRTARTLRARRGRRSPARRRW